MALKLWSVLSARMAMRLNSLSTDGAPLLLIVADQWTKTCNLSSVLIPLLVTGIQQRRVCGAGSVLSAQGLGLAGFL
jgi:hypothetical protein